MSVLDKPEQPASAQQPPVLKPRLVSGGPVLDAEMEEYRGLVQTPSTFRNGFTWISVAGAVFCGLVMFPGAIYLGLLSGMGMNAAATWVTVIVFTEITRRALKSMSQQEMVILLIVAGSMIGVNAVIPGGPFGELVWRQYLVNSDVVRDAGLLGQFPAWYAPAPDSVAFKTRTFFDHAWMMPIVMLVFMTIIGFIQNYTLGYALYRLTSDVEKLPFPTAPIAALGLTALATDDTSGEKNQSGWRSFSIGTMLGLGFGLISVGVPAISSAFLEKPITVLPIPWFETTHLTEGFLPATPTGLIVDLGLILLGCVMPFWAVAGSALAMFLTLLVNPLLFKAGVLTSWKPGMDTINTQFSNNVDFYFSAGIGMAIGIAIVSVYQTVRQLRASLRELKAKAPLPTLSPEGRGETTAPLPTLSPEGRGETTAGLWSTPAGRGDWSLRTCFIGYFLAALAVVIVCKWLVPSFPLFFLVVFAFVYTPLVSYLNARILGIAGTNVDIPFVREGFILLSGAKGLDVWLAPVPIQNYGATALSFRQLELTGTKLNSTVKAALLTTPLVFILSLVFWSLLWQDGPIPSQAYPYAQQMWDLNARNTMIMWSSTTGTEGTLSLFDRSFHPPFLYAGTAFSVALFTLLSVANLPTIMVYGFAAGVGQIPHGVIMMFAGALLSRYYFQRRFGRRPFLLAAPSILAGYLVGSGLIGMAGVAVRLITAAISASPY